MTIDNQHYFDRDVLGEYLLEVQKICGMNKEDALNELDAFLESFITIDQETELKITSEWEPGCELRTFENQLDEAAKWAIDLDSFDRVGRLLFDFDALKKRIEDSKDYWNDTAPENLRPKYHDLLDKLDKTSKLVEVKHAVHIINYQKERARNIWDSRVRGRILESLEAAMSMLESSEQAKDKVRADVRGLREQCAWYCANKTMSDMDLAIKCGQEEQAEKLRVKAQTKLEHDWAKIFGDEKPPMVEGRNKSK